MLKPKSPQTSFYGSYLYDRIVPADHLLPERLAGVLAVVYLIFMQGYPTGDATLRQEAIRLGRLVASLMPDEPEALGLVALLLLHDSRSAARHTPDGDLVLLADQDRSRWDRAEIAEGVGLLDRALRHGTPGQYQLQATIAAPRQSVLRRDCSARATQSSVSKARSAASDSARWTT